MATPKWPHDHEEKHRAAAKLGWRRRKHTQSIKKTNFGSGHHTEKSDSALKARYHQMVAEHDSLLDKAKALEKRRDFKKAKELKERARAMRPEIDRLRKYA